MSEYPLTIDDIFNWFQSKQLALDGADVRLAEIHSRTEYTPAAYADFDGLEIIGRITAWVTGEVDFEVLRVSDGEFASFQHMDVSSIGELERAYDVFLANMRARF